MSAKRIDFTLEYTGWCSVCAQWEATQKRLVRNAYQHLRKLGWGQTAEQRLLCPSCFEAYKKGEENLSVRD